MKQLTKRTMAWLLAAVLLFSVFGVPAAWATDGATETNVALNKNAIATFEQINTGSDAYNAYATNAVDGDLSSRWSSYGGPSLPQALQIDLGTTYQISRLVIYWFGNGRTFTFDGYLTDEPVVVSQTIQSGFTPVLAGKTGKGSGDGSVGSSGSQATEYILDAPAAGRYLTIVTTSVTSGGISAIWELEAYGIATGEEPTTTVTGISGFTDRYVPFGTAFDDLDLPEKASVTLSNGVTVQYPLTWSCENYNPNVSGSYGFQGVPVIEEETNVTNPDGISASMTVIVAAEGEYLSGRQTYNINSDWKFRKGTVSGAQAVDFDDSRWEDVTLPHTWNALDGQDGGNNYYRGESWYRKVLPWDASYTGRRVVIEFLGIGSQAELYVNGVSVGTHKGAFTAFRFDITDALIPGQDNVLAVKASNANVPEIAPVSIGPWYDFTLFGGIYRDVSLLVTDPIHADTLDYGSSGLKLTTSNVSKTSADLNIASTIVNDSAEDKEVTVRAVLKDPDSFQEVPGIEPLFDVETMYGGDFRMEVEQTVTIPAGSSVVFSKDLTVENPRLWNGMQDPYRYQVNLTVTDGDQTLDTVTQYVGFRYFQVDYDQGFFLNGAAYPLRGVSRHQDREDMGTALTQQEHNEDFALIYEMGANAVRLAHYPQAPYFYELCDKYGIVVWAEIPFVNNIGGSGTYENPDANRQAFFDVTRQQLIELIRQQYNRPSICFWGLQNEVLAYDECMPQFIAELNDLAHQEDPTGRLTTQATDKANAAAWETDLLAWNTYPGWYFGTKDDLGSDMDAKHAADSRPIAISEYGAGANVQQHVDVATDADKSIGAFQPEEYQSLAHEAFIQQINERPYLWATFVWNMFDFSSDWRSEASMTGINTKGLVSRDRTVKKDAFYLYKANWSVSPVAYITSRRNDVRANALNQIKVYSNCDSVELQVNGMVIGTLTQDQLQQDTVFIWDDVKLSLDENIVEIRAFRDGEVYTDSVVWEKIPGTSTDIQSDVLNIDNDRKIIALQESCLAENVATVITSAANASIQVVRADGETPVTSGQILPGMQLFVTSEDGQNTCLYTFLPPEIAAGKPVTASSYQDKEDGTYPAALANDGNTSTRWAAGFVGSVTSYPQWICIDLGTTCTLSRVDVSWFTGSSKKRVYYYTVSVSDTPDGPFTQVIDHTENDQSGQVCDTLSEEVSGRYVRIDVTGNSDYPSNQTTAASIYEVYVYGNNPALAQLQEAKTAAAAAIAALSPSNQLTEQEILAAVQGAVAPQEALVQWAESYQLEEATTEKEGSITGVLELTIGLDRVQLPVSLSIPMLKGGDLDGDGAVTVSDVVALRQAIVLGRTTEEQQAAGDLNNDGVLSVTDVVLLRQAIVNQK